MAGGRPEFATNTPNGAETVAAAIQRMLAYTDNYEDQGRQVSIASAYFNVGGWALLSPELTRVGTVRLMLGAEPDRHTDPVVLRPGVPPPGHGDDPAWVAALAAHDAALAHERDRVPFTAAARGQVRDLIKWLRSGHAEVRQYRREFLHGKAYLINQPPLGVIAGSSNFTTAGLSRNRELNLGHYSETTIEAVTRWFDDLWGAAEPFDLAEFYERQVLPDDPWLVFLRMLWEAYGVQIHADDEDLSRDSSLRNLHAFQKDGVARARRILERHNGVLIADEVGLGKTYVGGALVKDAVRARQRVLIIAPKIIRDTVWKPYIDKTNLAGWVDVISYDDLLADITTSGRRWRMDVARHPDEYALVLLDEAHTVRNSETRRAEALIDILKSDGVSGTTRKKVVLLTATPLNNSFADLHSLLSYFIVHDDAFAEIGIPSLGTHFQALDKMATDELSPELLFDVLDAVAVRRTRQFVRQHYIGQRIDDIHGTLTFPEPVVRRVDYDLAPVLKGFFDQFAHALGADKDPGDPDPFYAGRIPTEGLSSLDPTRLTLAGYTPSRYLLTDENDTRRQKVAEVQLAGLLRAGLLKRFESSSRAFTITCRKMAATLEGLLSLIQSEGLVANGQELRDWIRLDAADLTEVNEWRDIADKKEAGEYLIEALIADIENDVRLLHQFADTIDAGMDATPDPKLTAFTDTLVRIAQDAAADAARNTLPDSPARHQAERDNRKVIVFSFFADTVAYLHDHINEILIDPRLECYRGRVAFVTGNGEGSTVPQDDAIAGFAPRTAGQIHGVTGEPVSEDRYDLLITTDVLAQGVNLQQARNVINIDLPFNPQVLVQRHGRCDRIGSTHPRLYLWCFFPDTGLDRWLGLERILHTKLAKAAASIGHGHVLPGVAASDDRVFNARTEQIRSLADEDTTLLTAPDASLISGEEFRAMLRDAIADHSLTRHLESMPHGVGSGFVTNDRAPGFVFCARIGDRNEDPVFRFVALPEALIPGSTVPPPDPKDLQDDPRPRLHDIPVDVRTDTLTALTNAAPPNRDTKACLPTPWQDLAYDAWTIAVNSILDTWNASLDTVGPALPYPVRRAITHLLQHNQHRIEEDVDAAIRAYKRTRSRRITALVAAVMTDPDATDPQRTDRLIELANELGLVTDEPETSKRRLITADEVSLIAWMAIIPEGSALPLLPTEPPAPMLSPSQESLIPHPSTPPPLF